MDATPVVAVERLHDAREADPLGGGDRAVLRVDDIGARHRQPGRVEQAVGQALVRRDVDPDGRRLRRHGRADPLLVDAVAELDERVSIEADERDVATHGLVDERLRRGAEGLPLGEPDESLELRAKSKKTSGSSGATRWLTSATAIRPASSPTASSRYSKMQLYWPCSPAERVLPWRTSVPARFWNSSAMCSAMWPGPGPVAQPRDESAAASERTGVVLERRAGARPVPR